MIINKRRIRTDYDPLTTAVSLDVLTPHSSTGQVYDPNGNSYIPDREITPLVIKPNVQAMATDGSWSSIYANDVLADKKWFANGVDISTLSEWNGKYTIQDGGINNGTITILLNIPTEDKIDLHFEAIIPDMRTGLNIPIQSNPIPLVTVDKSKDSWELSLNIEPTIEYNPFFDKLLIYDYKLANGLDAGNRDDALDANCYEKHVELLVTRGGVVMDSDYVAHYYKINGQSMVEITDNIEVISKDNNGIVLDLRLIEKSDFLIIIKSEDNEVARQQFSVSRIYPPYSAEVGLGASINPLDILYRNIAFVSYNDNVVKLPEPIIRMIWLTDTVSLQNKEWQEGSRCVVELSKTGIGKTYLDNWLEMYIASEQKKAFEPYDYTDNDGNIYIGN